MIENRRNEYHPDVVSAPGETLLDVLEERGLSQAELAERTGRPLKTINEIVKGKTALTPDTAIQLERVLNVPAAFWNQRESNYRAYIACQKEQQKLNSHGKWIKQFPISEMVKRKWITDPGKQITAQIIALLNFFGVASPEQWEEGWTKKRLAFRTSRAFKAKAGPTSVWIRRGEIEAEKVVCSPFDRSKLQDALPKLRELTRMSDPAKFVPKLITICAEAGVAVVLIPALPGVRISGASKWLSPTKATIQLSLRGKSDDLLWFTVFHEINHILHHSKKELFVNINNQLTEDTPEEEEADKLTAEMLIPRAKLNEWIEQQTVLSKANIESFSEAVGISAGIVVGRLQFLKKIPFNSPLNSLKVRYTWSEPE